MGCVARRAVLRGALDAEEAATALRALPTIVEQRYAHTGPLSALAWELRHSPSYYDSPYVALASMPGLPLLTADVRLSRSPGLTCPVHLVN